MAESGTLKKIHNKSTYIGNNKDPAAMSHFCSNAFCWVSPAATTVKANPMKWQDCIRKWARASGSAF
jgi:hypothetical protein